MSFLADFSKAISRMEGWSPGTEAFLNNNPGNLIAGKRSTGKSSLGYAIYVKVSDGWADLEDLIQETLKTHPSLTVQTFFAGERASNGAVIEGGYPGYAPAADPRGQNQPNQYAWFVAQALKVDPGTELADKLTSIPPALP
jgi:hypothetical protein